VKILVTVNPRRCAASENCLAVAPSIFEVGSAGYSRVKREDLSEADLDLLRDAEQGCPNQAITVEVAEEDS